MTRRAPSSWPAFLAAATSCAARRWTGGTYRLPAVPMRAPVRRSQPARDAAISIRQHEIGIAKGPGDHGGNVLPGTVVRKVFLGNTRDYSWKLRTAASCE